MDPELKQLLEENLRLSKENNQLLLKVRSVQIWAQITRAIYWFVIIGITFGAFYFMKPYLGGILDVYSGGAASAGIGKNMDINSIQQLVKDLNN